MKKKSEDFNCLKIMKLPDNLSNKDVAKLIIDSKYNVVDIILELITEAHIIDNTDDIQSIIDKFRLKDVIEGLIINNSLYQIMTYIQQLESTDNIIDSLDSWDVENYFEYSDLCNNVREEGKEDGYKEGFEAAEKLYTSPQKNLTFDNMSPDDIHKYICTFLDTSYSDIDTIKSNLKKLISKWNENTYEVKI